MKIFLLILMILVFPSCSKISIGVYWADTFALSKINDFFTLSADQKAVVKNEFRLALKEVRRTEFPIIADLLEEIALAVENKSFTEEKIASWSVKSIDLLKQSGKRFEPLAQKLMEWQAPLGFAKFDEAFLKGQEKRSKKLLTPEKRLEQAKTRIERVIEEALGELNPAQENMAELVLKENPLLLENENRLFSFEKFRLARVKEKERREYVKKYFYDWDSLQNPEYIAARNVYQKKSRALILQILSNADEGQRKHLIEKFRDRASQLRKLSLVGDN
jgi:hypothetical protein